MGGIIYIVLKYDVEGIVAENTTEKHANYTLQEAMKISVIRG
jgi:antitoxin Phd